MSTKKSKVTKVSKPAKIKVAKAPRPLLTLPLKPKKPKVKEKTITLSDVDKYLGAESDYDISDELSMGFYEALGHKVERYTNSWGDKEWKHDRSIVDPKYKTDYGWFNLAKLEKLTEYIKIKQEELPGIDGTKKLSCYIDDEYIEFSYEARMYPTPEEIHAQNKRFDAAMDRYEKALEVYNHPVSVEARRKRDEKESKLIQSKVDKLKKQQEALENKLKKAS